MSHSHVYRKPYEVELKVTYSVRVIVNAKNREEAKNLVLNKWDPFSPVPQGFIKTAIYHKEIDKKQLTAKRI